VLAVVGCGRVELAAPHNHKVWYDRLPWLKEIMKFVNIKAGNPVGICI